MQRGFNKWAPKFQKIKKRNKNEENSNMRENANLGKCPVGGLHVRKENPLFSFLFLQFCVRKSARSFFLFLVIMPNERKVKSKITNKNVVCNDQ